MKTFIPTPNAVPYMISGFMEKAALTAKEAGSSGLVTTTTMIYAKIETPLNKIPFRSALLTL